MDKFTKEFFKAAVIRAIRTGAQVALSMLAVGMTLTEVDWLNLLSVTVMAMIVSMLTAIATGLPETKIDGTMMIDEIYYEDANNTFHPGDTVRLKVEKEEGVDG